MDLEIERNPTEEQIEELRESLIAYNVGKHGYTDASKIGIFVRNDDDELEGGVYAYAWGGVCELELLWVSEARRGDGLGTRLMTAVEDEARRVGCSKIYVDTFSYQAPGFYEKLGFERVGTIDEFPEGGHRYVVFVKRIT